MVGRRFAVLATAFVAALLCAAPAALAAVTKSGPLRYSTVSGSVGDIGVGKLGASCPGASRIASIGGSIANPQSNSSGLSNLEIFGARDGGSSTAYNDSSQPAAQRTTAVCLARGGGALTYDTSEGVIPANETSYAQSVSCTSGRLLAGAIATSGVLGSVSLEELAPQMEQRVPSRTTLAWALSRDFADSPIDYAATAICLPSEVGKLRYVYRARVAFGYEKTTVRAPCPKGTRVIGGGVGRFPTQLEASEPYDDGDAGKVPDDGWSSRSFNFRPTAVITHAVCLG